MKKSLKNPFTQKVRTAFFASSLVVLFSLTGCSKADDVTSDSCVNWSQQFLAQAEEYFSAATIYSDDPTVSNCNNVKAKGLNYVKAIESVLDCIPAASRSVYTDDLKELRADINETACNN